MSDFAAQIGAARDCLAEHGLSDTVSYIVVNLPMMVILEAQKGDLERHFGVPVKVTMAGIDPHGEVVTADGERHVMEWQE